MFSILILSSSVKRRRTLPLLEHQVEPESGPDCPSIDFPQTLVCWRLLVEMLSRPGARQDSSQCRVTPLWRPHWPDQDLIMAEQRYQ